MVFKLLISFYSWFVLDKKMSLQSRLPLTNPNLSNVKKELPRQQSAQSRHSLLSANSHQSEEEKQHHRNVQYARPLSRNSKKRNSVTSNDYVQVPKLENTFSLGPNESQKFTPSRIEEVVQEILSLKLNGVRYDPQRCKKFCKDLSEEIKKTIKPFIFPRYKLVVTMAIGQNTSQESLIMGSRALWNAETDNQCTVNFKNETLYAVATIFAVYFD